MILNPMDPRIKGTCEEAMKRGEELKSKEDILNAKVQFQIAASLALYEGNIDYVKAAYEELSSLVIGMMQF